MKQFKVFSLSWGKSKRRKKVIKTYGVKAYPRLLLLEEKFFSAHLCYRRLRNRNRRYDTLLFTKNLLANSRLRTLHSDEYFFFTTCGHIFKEIVLLQKQGLLKNLPSDLFNQLYALNEERRYHEHGKEWYWGESRKNNPPIPTKGDNFDFDKNMEVLRNIYSFIAGKLTGD